MKELIAALDRLGWFREDDVNPKGNEATPWPYFSWDSWRCLIGTLGWATIYRKDAYGIHDIESRRVSCPDDVIQLARSRMKAT